MILLVKNLGTLACSIPDIIAAILQSGSTACFFLIRENACVGILFPGRIIDPTRKIMATLVFDIETTALPLEQFDETQQEYLFRETEKIDDATAREAKRGEITRFMSLWPFTSQVVCIAMLNAETGRGQVQFLAEDFEDDAGEAGPVEFMPCADEIELLTAFWDVAKHYDSIVTFNGRGFDVPFIYLRSALLNVPISKKKLARLPLCHRAALRPRGAIDVLQREREGRGGAAVQLGFLLQGVRH